MDNKKIKQMTALAKKRLALLLGNYRDYSECAEEYIHTSIIDSNSETREISLDSAIETLGYMNICVGDIGELLMGVLNCLESAITQKTYKSGLQKNSTTNCTYMQSKEIQQQILSFANLLNNLK